MLLQWINNHKRFDSINRLILELRYKTTQENVLNKFVDLAISHQIKIWRSSKKTYYLILQSRYWMQHPRQLAFCQKTEIRCRILFRAEISLTDVLTRQFSLSSSLLTKITRLQKLLAESKNNLKTIDLRAILSIHYQICRYISQKCKCDQLTIYLEKHDLYGYRNWMQRLKIKCRLNVNHTEKNIWSHELEN